MKISATAATAGVVTKMHKTITSFFHRKKPLELPDGAPHPNQLDLQKPGPVCAMQLTQQSPAPPRANERRCQVRCLSFPPVEDGELTVAQIKTGFPVVVFLMQTMPHQGSKVLQHLSLMQVPLLLQLGLDALAEAVVTGFLIETPTVSAVWKLVARSP